MLDSKPYPVVIGIVLAGLLMVPLAVRDDYYLHLFIVSAIFVVVALGLNLIVGYVGQLSLAHAAFFALGAYVSALLFFRLKWSMWIGLPAAVLVSGVTAFALGWVILRVRGHRFMIITVAFAEIMKLVATNWVDMTRGFMGLPGIQLPALYVPGIGVVDISSKERFYYVVLAAALLSFYICYRLVRSSIGRAFVLVRERGAGRIARHLRVPLLHDRLRGRRRARRRGGQPLRAITWASSARTSSTSRI